MKLLRKNKSNYSLGNNISSNDANSNKVVLYGIISSKQWGNAAFVKAPNPEYVPFVDVPVEQPNINTQQQQQGGKYTSLENAVAASSFMSNLYK